MAGEFLNIAQTRPVAEKFARIWAMTEYVHNLAFEAMRRRDPTMRAGQPGIASGEAAKAAAPGG